MAQMIRMLGDRLMNLMTGMGTSIDKAVNGRYLFMAANDPQAEAAYRSDWMMRKIIDIPPLDMTRAWRAWQAESNDIEIIEAEEKRLQLKAKVKRALILARLWGGSAILIGIEGDDPEKELIPANVKKGSLSYLHVFAKSQISVGQMITDPASPYFGQPDFFRLTSQGQTQIKIHPSRVIAFVGQPAPEGSTLNVDWFWGDPLFSSIQTALQNAGLAQDGFAALIDEAKIDIVKIPELMETWSTEENQGRFLDRLQAAQNGKSTWRMLALDGEEDWQQRQITWAGMPDIISSYLQIVAGAADIPVTRFLGQSPKGLNSTGDGEERDYHSMIEARQDELLTPALDRIDPVMMQSAMGSVPSDIWWKYNPLTRLTEKDAIEVEFKRSQTVKQYSDTGLIEPDALSTIAKNAINESGQWPGSEKAFEEAEIDPAFVEGDNPPDPNELLLPEERAAAAAAAASAAKDHRRPLITDARPRSLYVSRPLLNAADLIKWAKAQGFKTTQPAEAMHVTVVRSRKPVDWMKIAADWSGDEKGQVHVRPGGARVVEPLGDKGAIVLLFRDDNLEWRHRSILDGEVESDFPEYQPHVTITWDGGDIDLESIEPYQGPLVFGPERFEEVKDDWEKTIVEDGKRREI